MFDPRNQPAPRRDGSLREVNRDLEQHRPAPPAGREPDGGIEQRPQVFAVPGGARVLDHRNRHPRDVRFLKGHRSGEVSGDLAADEHDRQGIHPRIRDGGQQVDGPRPGGRQRHTRPAGDACPPLRGVSRGGLMTGQDVPDPARGESVVQRQRGTPGHTEDGVDSVARDRFDQGIGGTHSQLLPCRRDGRNGEASTRKCDGMTASMDAMIGERAPRA